MKFILWFAAVVPFIVLVSITEALACSCMAPPTVPEAFAKSKNVLIISLMGDERVSAADGGAGTYGRSAIMRVEKVYKGSLKVNSRIKVFNGGGGDCTAGFQDNKVGDKFLVFIGAPGFAKSTDLYMVGLCGRSKPLDAAAPDLDYLDNRATREGKTRLFGIIQAIGENTKLPSVANLKVTVSGRAFHRELTTNAQGYFDIWGIRPGVYTIKYWLPRGWKFRGHQVNPSEDRSGWQETSDASFQVTILRRKHTEVRSYIVIDSSISGRVLSPNGNPLKGVCIRAYWLTPTSGSYRIPEECSDENGEFSIDQLPPGSYRIEVNGRGRLSSSNPFETFYYPSTTEIEHSKPVTVGEGLSVRNLVIQVKEMVPLIRVSGVLQLKDGRPIAGTEVKFLPDDEDRYEEAETVTDDRGRFSFELPQGAAGRLRAEVNIFESRFDSCSGIVSLRPSRSGNGRQSTFDFSINGQTSIAGIQILIPLNCSSK